LFTTDTGVRYRYSNDPLKDGDFEKKYKTWAKGAAWDTEGAALKVPGPWKQRALVAGAAGGVTLNKTSPIAGDRDAKITGEANLVLNPLFNTDLTSWTDGSVGDGSVSASAAQKKEGAKSALCDGGTTGAGTKISQQIAVTAEVEYSISAWIYGDGASGGGIRVIDDASGEYLGSDATWGAGAAAYAIETGAAWAYKPLVFTTKAAATTVTIECYVVANAGAAYFDAVMLSRSHWRLEQTTFFNLKKGTGYSLGFTHLESLGLGSLRYAVFSPLTSKYLQSGGTWTTDEYWFTVTPSTTAAAVLKAFTTETDADKQYTVFFQPESLASGTPAEFAQLDRVFIALDALTTDAQLSDMDAGGDPGRSCDHRDS
jgi:hypothetical protein